MGPHSPAGRMRSHSAGKEVARMDAPIDWLLDGEPWIVYRTRIDLLGEPDSAKPVQAAREGMRRDPNIHALLAALADWPGVVISSHKSANQPFHRLTFVADLGL